MGTTTMTNPTPARPAKKTGASRNSKLISASLAVATGVGVAGMVAVRMAQDVSAQDAVSSSSATQGQDSGVTTSSDGYTKAQLDAYAQVLNSEALRLQDYRDKLVAVSNTPQSGNAQAAALPAKPPAKPKVAKPIPAQQVKAQPAPQSKSKTS